MYNNNINIIKQDFEKNKNKAKIEYDKKAEDINKKFSLNKNDMNNIDSQKLKDKKDFEKKN